MNPSRTSAAFLAAVACFAGVSGFSLLGCSSADPSAVTPVSASPTPDHAVIPDAGAQMCTTFESCPNIPCFCAGTVVNARGCDQGRCLDTLQTCTEACKGSSATGSGSGSGPGYDVPDSNGSIGDTSNPAYATAAAGDACVPVSVSAITRRVTPVFDIIVAHLSIPATPLGGAVHVSRDQNHAITRISYDSPNNAADYVDTLTYDRIGRLSSWFHDGTGVTDTRDTFEYGLLGHITAFSRNVEGAGGDVTERFSYNLKGRLNHWTRNGDGFGGDVVESFSYENGLIVAFDHNGDGIGKDVSERFSYDASGRVTDWTTNGDRTIDDASVKVTYYGTSQVYTTGDRAVGATVKVCQK